MSGENWWWCYPDELFVEIDDAPSSPSHPWNQEDRP